MLTNYSKPLISHTPRSPAFPRGSAQPCDLRADAAAHSTAHRTPRGRSPAAGQALPRDADLRARLWTLQRERQRITRQLLAKAAHSLQNGCLQTIRDTDPRSGWCPGTTPGCNSAKSRGLAVDPSAATVPPLPAPSRQEPTSSRTRARTWLRPNRGNMKRAVSRGFPPHSGILKKFMENTYPARNTHRFQIVFAPKSIF